MTSGTPDRSGVVKARVRRLTEVPQKVEGLSEELSALRSDVAQLRREVIDLTRHLPVQGTAATVPESGQDDDGIELFAERMAVLEDGLDEVAERLEGITRDGVSQVSAQLERLTQRVDSLAGRPSLTQEQLEEILARVAQPTRTRSST